MDKRDKILLRILTICVVLFVGILIYVVWNTGQSIERSNNSTSVISGAVKDIYKDLDKKQKEIDDLKLKVDNIEIQPGKDGKNGVDGKAGKDGVTKIENHETQTTIEKQIAVEPIPAVNGKTPRFAIDGETGKWLMQYEGDEEWFLVPTLCQGLTVVCNGGQR
jgi:hypothetical protein